MWKVCRKRPIPLMRLPGMTFGTLPNQALALEEMMRVVKPVGMVYVGAYGPEHYLEALDASFRSIKKRCILDYRLEWRPRNEKYMRNGIRRPHWRILSAGGTFGATSLKMAWRPMTFSRRFQPPGGTRCFQRTRAIRTHGGRAVISIAEMSGSGRMTSLWYTDTDQKKTASHEAGQSF